MLLCFITVIGLVGGVWGQMPVSSCQDLDTQACQLFQTAKPDLCSDPSFSDTTCKRFCGRCPLECYSCTTSVMDPRDCNTTLTCGNNMTCMTKHLRATDGHNEYIMSCEQKAICDGLSFGFGFGKRDITEVEELEEADLERYQRDVSLSCCDTDFCNMPSMTTTTLLPPTTTPVTANSLCPRDIVFMIDDSGSVGRTNFGHSVEFVRQLIQNLNIGPSEAQVSVMEYSSHPQISWLLGRYTDKNTILSKLSSLRYVAGSTNTGEALEAVRTKILEPGNGERPSAENVVIVLTDGRSTHKTDTLQQANQLHTVSKDVVSIVIGSGIDKTELNAIATDQQHIFDLRAYTDLPNIVQNVLNLICN